ncbi:acyl carrier protein [Bauldia litoralis]|uniref:acyl carrier protein n=1 Tax=Bauldia litoralis TaxID=665467 RepID=UPI0032670DBF
MEPEKIRKLVIEKTANLAGIKPDEITAESNLEALGLDSADAVVLAMEIEQETGREIEVGLFLRCETVAEAAEEIARLTSGGDEAKPDAAASSGEA